VAFVSGRHCQQLLARLLVGQGIGNAPAPGRLFEALLAMDGAVACGGGYHGWSANKLPATRFRSKIIVSVL
jgi:hypothetical protein